MRGKKAGEQRDAGEAEGRLDGLLQDAASCRLPPIYNYLNDLPRLDGAPTPFLLGNYIRLTLGNVGAFDALQTTLQILSLLFSIVDQTLFGQHFECLSSGRARQGVAAKSRSVVSWGKQAKDVAVCQHSGNRIESSRKSLADDHYIRTHTFPITSKKPPRTA